MATPSTVNGSCLCGAIGYKIKNGLGRQMVCHCGSCCKVAGSAFVTNSFILKENFEFTKGEDKVKWFVDTTPDSGNPITRGFCPECGSSLLSKNDVKFPQIMVVAAGSLDGVKSAWNPDAEVFCKDRASWVQTPSETVKFQTGPS